jgi:CheY-like chemotaxis protein
MLPDDLILIAEDNESDALLLQRTFNLIGLANRVQILSDGVEVTDYLSGAGKYADRASFPFPAVLFTDIKMPRFDGFELLQWLRENPEYAVVPTIVFSGSGQAADVKRAYNLGANAYLVKPSSIDQLEKMMRRTYEFWGLCAETLTTTTQPAFRPEMRLCGMG